MEIMREDVPGSPKEGLVAQMQDDRPANRGPVREGPVSCDHVEDDRH